MDPADAVLRFLESVGRRSEAEFYLGLFRAEAKERFAAIVVDATVARHALDAVVQDLRFLAGLGLYPLVVFGLFDPGEAAENTARVARRLGRADVPATVLPPLDTPERRLAIVAASNAGQIPLLALDALDGGTVEDRFARFGALLSELKTRKLIFLHRKGGLPRQGQLAPIVNLTTEFDEFAASKELTRKQQIILRQSRRLVFELVPHKLLVAVTSPLDLLRELFTVKGAGTLLRRGAVIETHAGWTGVDRERLEALLSASFSRPPVEDFWRRPVARIYREESYLGAAIIVDTPLGGYLTKFAVDPVAQGEGIGRDLWERMQDDYPVLFWRARAHNSITRWYAEQADGLERMADWHVFWKGLPPERIPEAIAFALAQPIDIPPADGTPAPPG